MSGGLRRASLATNAVALLALVFLAAACADRDLRGALPEDGGGLDDAGATGADGGGRDGGVRRDGGPAARDGGSVDGGSEEDGGIDGGIDDGGVDGGPSDAGPRPDAGFSIPDGGDIPCETAGASREADPNDRPQQANRIAPGTAVRGKLTPETDEDWYLLQVCNKSLLEITLDMQGPATPPADAGAPFGTPVDPRVDVIGADGTTLLNWVQNRTGSRGATALRVVALAEAPGPIYLRVTDLGNDGKDDENEYRLAVTTLPIPDADREPDGNKGGAISSRLAHPLTENVLETSYLASTRDEDWYKLIAPGLRLADIVLTDSPALGTPLGYRMRLLGPDAITELTRVEARPPGPSQSVNFHLRAQLPAAGDYYVVISDSGEASDRTRPYRLAYSLGTVPDPDVEPNDTAAQARPILAGTPQTAYIGAPRDADWYKIDVTGSSRAIRAELTLPATARTSVDYVVSVFAPDGVTELAQATDFDGLFGDVSVSASAYATPSALPYFIRVTDWREDDFDLALPYRLVVTLEDVPDAAQEPNESALAATPLPLTPGTPTVRTGYIATQRDVDFYSFEVAAGQAISATVSAGVTSLQYRVSLRDRGGETRIADNYDFTGRTLPNDLPVSAPSAANMTPLAPGRYYLTVEDYTGDNFDSAVPYTLTLTVTGP